MSSTCRFLFIHHSQSLQFTMNSLPQAMLNDSDSCLAPHAASFRLPSSKKWRVPNETGAQIVHGACSHCFMQSKRGGEKEREKHTHEWMHN